MTRNFLHRIARSLGVAVVLGSVGLVGACGDDKGSTTDDTTGDATTGAGETQSTVPTTTGPEPTTGSETTGTVDPTTTTGPDPTTTTDPDPTTTGPDPTTSTTDDTDAETDTDTASSTTTGTPVDCLDMVEPGDLCGECVCMQCEAQYAECQADVGCVAISECVQESGCQGFDCAGPCGEVINMHGGFMGESVGKAIAFGECIGDSCANSC